MSTIKGVRSDLKSVFDIIETEIDITKGKVLIEFLDGKIIKASITEQEIYRRRKQ